MKVTNAISGLALALVLASCGGSKVDEAKVTAPVDEVVVVEEVATTLTIDAAKSVINWKGFKIGGVGAHLGTVTVKSGAIELDGDQLVGGEVVIDMTTIDNTDLEDPAYKAKLEGHLSSVDFFNVEKHTSATFKITSVEGKVINGELTVRGITVPVTADVKSVVSNESTVTVGLPSKFETNLIKPLC